MFANLNLQLTSILTSGDSEVAGAENLAATGSQDSDRVLSFGEFFSTSTEEARRLSLSDSTVLNENGDFLPQEGKPLPPEIALIDTEMPDKMIGFGEQPPVASELNLPLTAERDVADLVNVELTLDYSGNEIPAAIPAESPEDTLVLPPGLRLTAIDQGLPGTRQIPPEDHRVGPHKELRSVIHVPPSPAPTVSDLALRSGEGISELIGPQPAVSTLLADKRTRLAPQVSVINATVAADANQNQIKELRPVAELSEIVRQVASVEPQRQLDSHVTAGPGVHLGATPSSTNSDLNALRGSSLPLETIATPVREPAWGEKLAERVVMLAGVQTKTAEIRLTPAELGPLRVQISVDDGQAHVAFQAHNALTRDAIEQALPRLREMLAESGLTLGQTDVGEQGTAGSEGDRDAVSDSASDVHDDALEEHASGSEERRQKTVISVGLVDTFA